MDTTLKEDKPRGYNLLFQNNPHNLSTKDKGQITGYKDSTKSIMKAKKIYLVKGHDTLYHRLTSWH